MSEESKILHTRIQNLYDSAEEWYNVDESAVPLKGELVFYKYSSPYSGVAVKVGDGETPLKTLPFFESDKTPEGYNLYEILPIPEGITSICAAIPEGGAAEASCFYTDTLPQDKSVYKYVVIPSSVTIIGSDAFSGCTGLTSITIPNSVTSIGYGAFAECGGLESITIPFVGANKDGTSNTHFGYIFGASQYWDNNNRVPASLKTVVITSGSSIGSRAFSNCTGLTSITIPDSVTSISSSAFAGCTSLTSTTIPDSVTTIGDYAFYNCTGLTSVTIPNSVTSIGSQAFEGCTGIQTATMPALAISYIAKTSLKTVVITSGSSIGNNAFYECNSLTSITIPDGVTTIGDAAFYGCRELTSVTIPNSVTSIGYHAFYKCTGLTSITIGNSVTSIGGDAFYYCTSLVSVRIPESVTSIGSSAFEGCTSLMEVYLPTKVTAVSNRLFWGCVSLKSVRGNKVSVGEAAFAGCISLNSINISFNLSLGDSAFRNCKSITDITIPTDVTSIGLGVFSGCSSLKSITIPFIGHKCLTSADKSRRGFGYIFGNTTYEGGIKTTQYALWENKDTVVTAKDYYIPLSLKEVKIKGGVIYPYAFQNCNKIERITIEGITEDEAYADTTFIGNSAFDDCSSLSEILISTNKITQIKDYAFKNCRSLTYVGLEKGITYIDTTAFTECYSINNIRNLNYFRENKILYAAHLNYFARNISFSKNYPINPTTTKLTNLEVTKETLIPGQYVVSVQYTQFATNSTVYRTGMFFVPFDSVDYNNERLRTAYLNASTNSSNSDELRIMTENENTICGYGLYISLNDVAANKALNISIYKV